MNLKISFYKYLSLFFVFLLISFFSYSQIETTHLIKYEKIINPLFSKKLNQIVVNFDKINQIDSPNNSFNYLKIDISERKSELNGTINDFSLGSAISSFNNYGLIGGLLASSFNTSKVYSYKNTNGFVIFNKIKFDTLLNICGKISQINKSIKNKTLNNEKSYFFQVDKITITLEITLVKTNYTNESRTSEFEQSRNIIFKIDDSVFIFTDSEFEEFLLESLLPVGSIWDNSLIK
jgi:hypothetical protein